MRENPHVRFDERGVETEHGGILGQRQPKGPVTLGPDLTHRAIPRLYFRPPLPNGGNGSDRAEQSQPPKGNGSNGGWQAGQVVKE
jgi:hypothetical protein